MNNRELMGNFLDAMQKEQEEEDQGSGSFHPALETIMVRCEIWRQHRDIVPMGMGKEWTRASYAFSDALDELCEELITTEQLKDQLVKYCEDIIGVEVRWDHWRLRVETQSKAAA